MTDAPKPTLTEAEHDALVQAVGWHCSHTGPVDTSLPHGCRDCDDVVRVDIADTVALIKAAARREALLEAREDIRARRQNFRRLNADPQYLAAMDDAFGLVNNRLRDAERALAEPERDHEEGR